MGGRMWLYICSHKELVPQDQNCQTAGDGHQFLVARLALVTALWKELVCAPFCEHRTKAAFALGSRSRWPHR
jgi:hypothetical protein